MFAITKKSTKLKVNEATKPNHKILSLSTSTTLNKCPKLSTCKVTLIVTDSK